MAWVRLESDVLEEVRQIFSDVGRISHDDSEMNNFGRAGLRGTNDPAGPSDINDADPDEMGEKIFGLLEDLQGLIDQFFLPDDEVTNPTPLDCSSGLPDTSAMSSMIFGMDGVEVIIGTTGNDFLSGGSGVVNFILGLSGNDTLLGGSGGDSILGGDGDDTIKGQAGIDRLCGGDGTDLVVGTAAEIDSCFGNCFDDICLDV